MSMIARPASDVIEGGWTPTPLYSQLNEVVPDDTTKVDSGTAPDTFEVALSPLPWPPPGPQVLSVRLRQAGDEPATAFIKLLQGSLVIAVWVVPAPQDFTTFSFTLLASQVSQITDYTALRVQVTIPVCTGSSGGGVSVPCCPNDLPPTLYLSYTGVNPKGVWLPNPIPLSYDAAGPFGIQGWFSGCLMGSTVSPAGQTFYHAINIGLTCLGILDPDQGPQWALESVLDLGSGFRYIWNDLSSDCSPVVLLFGDVVLNFYVSDTAPTPCDGPPSDDPFGLDGVVVTE